MNSAGSLILSLYLLIALPSISGDARQSCREQRAPSGSNKIGPFIVSYGMDPAEQDRILSQARGFLWDHLHDHATGQLQITFGNIEGDPTEHKFVVQLDKKGNIVILDHIATTEAALLKPGEKAKHKALLDRFCTFERIDKKTQRSIPDEEVRPAESFSLHLKNCKTGAALIL